MNPGLDHRWWKCGMCPSHHTVEV